MIPIVIADSNDLTRMGLRHLLTSQAEVEVVGEARHAEELLSQVEGFKPEVVVLDYTSPGFTIDVIVDGLRLSPQTRFVAVTPEQSAQTLVHALRSGVTSYVKKDCDLMEIVDSVKETSKGQRFFCGQILETIRKSGIDIEDAELSSLTCEPVALSNREMEIITLIGEGLTTGQVAQELNLSEHTVKTHRKNVMQKLGVNNTAGLVLYAVKTGLVSPNKFLFAPTDTN